jgi:predicted sulfurtransferase
MEIIVSFYKYVLVAYPKQILKWLQRLCNDFGFKGRILVGSEGINATLAGSVEHVERFKKILNNHSLFGDIDFKEAPGSRADFPRMQITIRPEIVRFGIESNLYTAAEAGIHLTPQEAHALIAAQPNNLLILDARNMGESRIGAFVGAITPSIEHFRELPAYIDSHADQFENKQVLMYCTGGIRCERASAYIKKMTKAQTVYQLQGGIQRYVEQYPDGYFRGKNYVFDARVAVRVTEDILSTCILCNSACDDYANCRNAECNKHFICCDVCIIAYGHTCSADCNQLVVTQKVRIRSKDLRANMHANNRKPHS